MSRWLLPVLLVAGQLLYWPGLPLLHGGPAGAVSATGVVAACLLAGAGLGWRRERPLAALAVVLAGNILATVAAPAEQQWIVPYDALLILWVSEAVALFSVAARAPARHTLWALTAVATWESVLIAVQEGVNGDMPISVLLIVALYGVVVALGRRRGLWNAERAEAARRLAAAQRSEREATDAERRRLARELHDVTAHHLTSIVVNSSAAEMLAGQRPDLKTEALAFAARTGRETLAALRQLVEMMPAAAPADEQPELTDLADGFRALGQRITLELPDGEPAPERAAVVYGIVREALTNTLRYAPGGEVLVRCTATELVIEDDGAGAPLSGTADGLGGGRGITGMRERAQTLGGTCADGARPGGGWRVRAEFPGEDGAGRRAYPWLRSQFALDGVLVVTVLVVQLMGIGLAVEEGLTPAATALVVLAQIVHAVPLFLRRQAAWWVFLTVVLTGLLGPLLVFTGLVPAGLAYVILTSCAVEFAAVYAVAAWGVRPDLAWLAVPAASIPWALAMTTLLGAEMSRDPEATGGPIAVYATTVMLTPVLAILLAVPGALCWGAGFTSRRRRDSRLLREEGGVAMVLEQAAHQARAERYRIATGLHEAVLRHAADVPGAADRGDISGVLSSARQALTAMRALLDGLHGRPGTLDTTTGPGVAEVATGPGPARQEVASSSSE